MRCIAFQISLADGLSATKQAIKAAAGSAKLCAPLEWKFVFDWIADREKNAVAITLAVRFKLSRTSPMKSSAAFWKAQVMMLMFVLWK